MLRARKFCPRKTRKARKSDWAMAFLVKWQL